MARGELSANDWRVITEASICVMVEDDLDGPNWIEKWEYLDCLLAMVFELTEPNDG